MGGSAGGTGLRGDIQGLRAVAVLGVVLFHAERWFHAGFIGVDVFFVISGYVITASIMSRRGGGAGFSIGDFYKRRARRILPALTFFLLLALPMVLVLGPANSFPEARRTATAASLFVSNVQLLLAPDTGYFDLAAEQNPFLHMWSLSVEEQFYVFYPLLFGGFLVSWFRMLSRDRTMGRLLIAFTAVSFVGMIGTISTIGTTTAFYMSPTRAWEFLAGALVAWYGFSIKGVAASIARFTGLGLIVSTMVIFKGLPWPTLVTVVPVLGAALVMAAGRDQGLGIRLLDNRPMRFLGSVSYSWYLWHWPMAVLARQADPSITWLDDVAVVAALVPATLSLRLVENPIRYSTNLGTRRLVRLSVASIAVVVVLAAVISPALDRALPGSTDDIAAEASGDHVFIPDACRDDPLLDPSVVSDCVVDGGPGASTAALVGDSEAAQLSIPFASAAQAAGWTGFVRIRAGCSFLPELSVEAWTGPVEGCDEFNDELWDALLETPPDVVVLSNNLTFPMADPSLWVIDPDGARVTDPERRRQLVIDEYTRVVAGLQAAGSEVVLIRRPPPTALFNIFACPRWRWVLDQASCGTTVPIATARAVRAHEDEVLDTVASSRGVDVLDYDADLCPGSVCRTHDGQGWVYADANHVTAQYSPRLQHHFDALFSSGAPTD